MRITRLQSASATGIYHVYGRGTEKRRIFEIDKDYARFLGRLAEYAHAHDVEIRLYCLMVNHFHLMAHAESVEQLSTLMHRLLTAYSVYFNRRYEHNGHLFQGRFQSRAVETEAYYEELIEYIKENPAKAGFRLDSYPWIGGTSFRGRGQTPAGV